MIPTYGVIVLVTFTFSECGSVSKERGAFTLDQNTQEAIQNAVWTRGIQCRHCHAPVRQGVAVSIEIEHHA